LQNGDSGVTLAGERPQQGVAGTLREGAGAMHAKADRVDVVHLSEQGLHAGGLSLEPTEVEREHVGEGFHRVPEALVRHAEPVERVRIVDAGGLAATLDVALGVLRGSSGELDQTPLA
jgi:hypothetical protein